MTRAVASIIAGAALSACSFAAQGSAAVKGSATVRMDAAVARHLAPPGRVPDGAEGHAMTAVSTLNGNGPRGGAQATLDFAAAFDEIDRRRRAAEALRTVPTAEALPPLEERAHLERLKAHVAAHGFTAAVLAKQVADLDGASCNPSVVRLLLEDPAKLPAEARAGLLMRLVAWLDRDEAERTLAAAACIETPVTKLVRNTARVVRATRTVGLIAGGSGLGKSFALERTAAELPGTVLVRIDPDSRGARGLLAAIGLAAGRTLAATERPTIKAGVELMRAAGGLLMLDEAQLAAASALEAARAIFDGAGCGLLLCGTRATTGVIAADPLCGPLAARVAVVTDIDGELLRGGAQARPWLGVAELRAIVTRAVGVDLDADAARLLHEAANYRDGHLRAALNACRVAALMAPPPAGKARPQLTGDQIAAALRLATFPGRGHA